MYYRDGDLLTMAAAGEFDLIGHGCNCMCRMGRGIALSIRKRYPAVYAADCETEAGDRDKLGTCTAIEVPGNPRPLTIVNAYTQYHWRGTGELVDYAAVSSCLAWIKARFAGLRMGFPLLGAGLAGGDWDRIADCFAKELHGEAVTIVRFVGETEQP